MQLATAMSPKLEAMKKEGEIGRMKINQYTRYLTVLLATVQAYGLAVGLESLRRLNRPAVINRGCSSAFQQSLQLLAVQSS